MEIKDFNSLPHTEVDPYDDPSNVCNDHFNSLPHTEVDNVCVNAPMSIIISTHYLTQR